MPNEAKPGTPMIAAARLAHIPAPRRSLLSVEEVAELLRVPVSWVYDRTRSRGVNRIPGFRLGKYWRFEEGEVLAWLERQRSGGRGSA
jgi:excisionase family DNA binding protein